MSTNHAAGPVRSAYAWLSGLSVAFVLYVSLLPLRGHLIPWQDAWLVFRRQVLSMPWGQSISGTDFLANVLLCLPFGFFLAGALLYGGSRSLGPRQLAGLILIPLGALILGMGVEFLQIFIPGRVASASDVAAQTAGSAIGVVLWMGAGPALTEWWRITAASVGRDRLARGLSAYAVGYVLIGLAPFDFTLDPGELSGRLRTGLIRVLPLWDSGAEPSQALWKAFAVILAGMPIGLLGLVGRTGGRMRRGGVQAAGLGILLIAAVEVVQVFTVSRTASATDLVLGGIGVAIGVTSGSRCLERTRADSAPGGADVSWRVLSAWCAWSLVVAYYHWMPFDFVIDRSSVRLELEGMSLIPFASYRGGADLNALTNAVGKFTVALPFGFAIPFLTRRRPLIVPLALAALGAVVMVLGAVEVGQLFLPGRTADPTDVLVGVAGASAGVWIGSWLRGGRTPPGT